MDKTCFVHHSSCLGELEEFVGKHGDASSSPTEALENLQRLLHKHFNVSPMFTNKHIGRAQGFDGYEVYWLHSVFPNCNLSRTQFPKIYFLRQETHLSFLCLDSHLQNYKDAKLRQIANERLIEVLNILEHHQCESG